MILLFEDFNQEDDMNLISDIFLEVSDNWNLRYFDGSKDNLDLSFLSRDNAYSIHHYRNHRGELDIWIDIFIISNPSKIVLIDDVVDLVGTGISSGVIKKHLNGEFIDDIDNFIKKVDKYYRDEKDEHDINLRNFISSVDSRWSKGEVSDDDINSFIEFSKKTNSSKIHSSVCYIVMATPFLTERDILFNSSKLDKQGFHRFYYYKIQIQFLLTKYK